MGFGGMLLTQQPSKNNPARFTSFRSIESIKLANSFAGPTSRPCLLL